MVDHLKMSELPDELVQSYLNSGLAQARLEWLLDKQPNLVKDLFQSDHGKEKLKENLVLSAKAAVELLPSEGDKFGPERAYDQVAPPVERERDQRALPEKFQKQVREWYQSLLQPPTETTESAPMTS